MAAVISSGLWPATTITYTPAPVYGRVTPRQAVGLGTTAATLLNPGTGGAVTTVPAASAFTRYPVSP
jgi:hypothetical protein